jgi:acyl transferase domain-containing protein
MRSNPARPTSEESIAVIAMQGRFPGANSVEELWENLKNGIESISTFSEEELRAAGVDTSWLSMPGFVNRGCTIKDIDMFDAGFFGYSARDAETIDPQQRIFLECSWEALEQAGYDPDTYPGMIGVFAGSDQSSYIYQIYTHVNPDAYGYAGMMSIGNEKDYLTTQVSYKMNLRGPSIAVQTSCSTSLVAVCIACQNLTHGYCDMAIAGGVGISVPQKKGYWYQPGDILSPDGHCRPFDAAGQGTVMGNGIGIVVLKPLSDAIQAGDNILAVIKGFALNNDGSSRVGYTAPSVNGQARVIRLAQEMARIEPDTVGYIEAHGTATALGDPIEIAALTKAFRERTPKKQYCAVGSLKSNVGHLSSAAGVAGLIKGVLVINNGQIPPSLHYKEPNPQIDFERTPFYVPTKLLDWPLNESPRRAGVSAFGVGGTNAHVVLEQAPAIQAEAKAQEKQLLVLSGHTPSALNHIAANLVNWLEAHPEADLADVAFTLQAGRKALPYRSMFVFDRQDRHGLVEMLRTQDPAEMLVSHTEMRERPVIFMFAGQGTQYVDMGVELYQKEPVFREHFEKCVSILKGEIGLDLRDIVYPTRNRENAVKRLTQTAITQPALFTIEYALSRMWMEWGIQPKATIGHSIGEWVSACLANVISLQDALSVVAMRGRLMDSMPVGRMLAVSLPEAGVQPFMNSVISLAAVNAPNMCVLSGPRHAIESLQKRLAGQNIPCKILHTSHAFHSSMMEPIIAQFIARLRRVHLRPPKIPYLSNVTGTWITPELATSPEYWGHHLRHTVRFADNLCEVMAFPDLTLLEVGPGSTLGFLAHEQGSRANSQLIFSSLPSAQEADKVSAMEHVFRTVGQMWLGGVQIDWKGFHALEKRRRIPLPTYPFERQPYWLGATDAFTLGEGQQVEPQPVPIHAAAAAVGFESQAPAPKPATADSSRDVGGWFWTPIWKPAVRVARAHTYDARAEHWLLFGDGTDLSVAAAERLRREGATVTLVHRGKTFARIEDRFELRPGEKTDYESLVSEIRAGRGHPTHVLHLWTRDAIDDPSSVAVFDDAQDRGFYSIVFLCQALVKNDAVAPVEIGVVTADLQAVIGDEELRSEAATVLGVCKVISQEYPNLHCRSIDLDKEGTADTIVGELSSEEFTPVVAYRRARRWIESFEQVQLERLEEKVPALKDGGVYLITGGLGNIGLLLAETIAQDVKAKFVLIGRSAFPPPEEWDGLLQQNPKEFNNQRIRRLRNMQKAGSEILILQADVSDREQMRLAIQAATERFGSIDGVIHGAANLAPDAFGALRNMTRASGEAHFRPKAHGLLILEDLLWHQPVDFWFLLSSLSAVLGGLGLASYSASNAYLDAEGQRQNRKGRGMWIAVNWDTWNFAAAPERETIGTREGADAFRRILASSLERVAVSAASLAPRLDQWVYMKKPARAGASRSVAVAGSALGAAESLTASRFTSASHARPNLSTQFVLPRTEAETAIARVWEHLLGVTPIGVYDKFFELGGHSLLAIQLLARLREIFNLDIPVQRIFETPTIAQLAESIERDKKEAQTAPLTGEVAEVLKLVENLSDDEIELLLREAEASEGATRPDA